MIHFSLILSTLFASLVSSQTTESSVTGSQSATTTDFSSVIESIRSLDQNASSILSSYSSQISEALSSISATAASSSTASTSSDGNQSSSTSSEAYGYPTSTSSDEYQSSSTSSDGHQSTPTPSAYGKPREGSMNVTCSILCHQNKKLNSAIARRSSQETEACDCEKQNNNSAQADNSVPDQPSQNLPDNRLGERPLVGASGAVSENDDSEEDDSNQSQRLNPNLPINRLRERPLVGASDAPCESKSRPNAPLNPWGWPSNYGAGRTNQFQCYYHAATAPECENIHRLAIASYCSKSQRPKLCVAKACKVLDQCKRIIGRGRGYCWNPKWF